MKAALHLTPGPHAAERAARRAARWILAASLATGLLLSLAGARSVADGLETSRRNEELAARIDNVAREIAAVEGDARWADAKRRSLALSRPLLAAGPRGTDALALVEGALPHYVSLHSLSFSRRDGTLLLDGESERYEGGEVLRSALSAPSTGWSFRLDRNGYDQVGKVYTFRLAGSRRGP